MITDDNLLCCLLPNKCNLYNRPLLVHIFISTFYSINFLLAIYILMTATYSLWQIWNQYCVKVLQNILSDLMCQNDQTSFDDVKNEHGISSKLINSYQYTDIKDNFDIIDISQCKCHCHVYNNSNHSTNQRSINLKNRKSESEQKTYNCPTYKVTDSCCSKMCLKQKEKFEDKHDGIKYKCSCIDTPNLEKEHFCIATYENKNLMKSDMTKLSISCWPLIQKIYNTKL